MSEWNTQEAKLVAETHRLIQEYHNRYYGEFKAQHAVMVQILFEGGIITEAQRDSMFQIIQDKYIQADL